MSDSFVASLEQRGYFTGLDAVEERALKKSFSEQGWLGIFADSHRFFTADAEDLAEGGIGRFILEVEPFLAAQGVALPKIEEDFTSTGYTVRVGEAIREIYSHSELERDADGQQLGLIWGLSAARGFRIINELLAAAGSPERIYAVNGGNDLFGFFLTPELFDIITNHPDASPQGGPYSPTEEYPWFGQPHDR